MRVCVIGFKIHFHLAMTDYKIPRLYVIKVERIRNELKDMRYVAFTTDGGQSAALDLVYIVYSTF